MNTYTTILIAFGILEFNFVWILNGNKCINYTNTQFDAFAALLIVHAYTYIIYALIGHCHKIYSKTCSLGTPRGLS